jgi:hypothetical protein
VVSDTLPGNLATANLTISIGVVFVVFSLWAVRRLWKLEAFNHPQEVSALLLWTIWWICLIVVYILVQRFKQDGATLGFVLLFLDIGSVSGLAFVIAYYKGHQFKWGQLEPILILLFFLAAWDILSAAFLPGAAYRMLVIAPSAIMANVFIVGIGWIFLVRWGLTALPFFVLTILYAVLQLPAYFELFVVIPFNIQGSFAGPWQVFFLLAVGKLMYACSFFAMFFSPFPNRPDMTSAQYEPPATRIHLHPRVWKIIAWGLGMVLTAISTAVIVALSERIRVGIEHFLKPH